MNAEVTAENRPACDPNEHVRILGTQAAHEDEGRVQIILILLHELLVIPLGLLVVVPVEFRPRISLSGR